MAAQQLPEPSFAKNDKKAKLLIWTVSVVVFLVVASLSRLRLNIQLPFDVHLFAKANAVINSIVAVFLIAGLITAKSGNYQLHKKIMMTAIVLSVLFLVSYICHHLFAGETLYGDLNGDHIVSPNELAVAGTGRLVYFLILFTHIPLASIILPFVLFTAYRALIGEYDKHRRLVRIAWPLWFYVAITGVAVYWMIAPYYN